MQSFLKSGIIGLVTAGAFQGIGNLVKAGVLNRIGSVVAHGIVGGVSSVGQGGKFGSGFVAAGFAQALSGPIGEINPGNPGVDLGRTLAAAVAGGVGSVLGGGKFANGAITGAFSRLFNDELHRQAFNKRYASILEKGKINLDANAAEASKMSPKAFFDAIDTFGKWDYKNNLADLGFNSALLDEFGNFHFGLVTHAYGLNLEIPLYGAGLNQVLRQGGGNPADLAYATKLMAGTGGGYALNDSYTRSLTNGGFTWGDNIGDSINIMHGWDYGAR